MKFFIAALTALFASSMALADSDCMAKAAEKKLSGAAKNSFTTKCVADGLQPLCESQATDKKLAGAGLAVKPDTKARFESLERGPMFQQLSRARDQLG
jgi:hypothetical protein